MVKAPYKGFECQTAQKCLRALHCTGHSNEPLKSKNAEAMASTFFESHFHGANAVSPNTFVCSDDHFFGSNYVIYINFLYQNIKERL